MKLFGAQARRSARRAGRAAHFQNYCADVNQLSASQFGGQAVQRAREPTAGGCASLPQRVAGALRAQRELAFSWGSRGGHGPRQSRAPMRRAAAPMPSAVLPCGLAAQAGGGLLSLLPLL